MIELLLMNLTGSWCCATLAKKIFLAKARSIDVFYE